MKEYQRTDRFSTALQRELAELLRDKVKDPRLGMITVQEVRVGRDLSHAKVYFTCMGADAAATATLLNRKLAGFLRHELSQRVRARSMPQLHFVYDESIERGEHLEELIEQAVGSEHASSDE